MAAACLQVLLVEDQESNIVAWCDRSAAHNSDAEAKGFSVVNSFAKSVTEAKSILENQRIDAVVVDLRLEGATGRTEPNDHGNALIEYVRQAHPVAMAIHSGQSQEAEVENCPQVEIFDRGDGLEPVFEWLGRQLSMLAQLRSTQRAFDRETARVFFGSIWPRWTNWTAGIGAESSEGLGAALTRHVIAHVHDSLLDAGGGVAHAEETYFIPPLKSRLDTGDLINRGTNGLWIVLTPRCDLATGKSDTLLLARCESIREEWLNASPKAQRKISQHNGEAKKHFLPELVDHTGKPQGPWMVKFHDLRTADLDMAKTGFASKRFASLAPQFVPSLVERFGAYFSRIGTPNLSSE